MRNQRAPAERGRTELGHDAIAVRDHDGFTSGRQADVLAELVFEQLDADRPHDTKVATISYLVKARSRLLGNRASPLATSNCRLPFSPLNSRPAVVKT